MSGNEQIEDAAREWLDANRCGEVNMINMFNMIYLLVKYVQQDKHGTHHR